MLVLIIIIVECY